MTSSPLAGVRILDFTALLPGAVCTMYLADLGADVIKIEPPEHGDAARGPKGTPPSGMFVTTNRNKRSLAIDLKQPESVQLIEKLLAETDVLVEGFRPGVMARFGLDYARLSAINPRLVYCSITGYGQTGPLADKAGHDINYQSISGVLAQNVIDGSRPSPGGFPIADLAGGGLSAATGILAALFDAQRTGRGRHIDISMTDCAMALNLAALSSKLMFGNKEPQPGRDILSGGLPCYRTYRTSDGRYLAVGALEPKFWMNFCNAVARPDLIPHGWDSGDKYEKTVEEIQAIIAGKTLAEWTAHFADVDACVTPVVSLDDSLVHEHAAARGMIYDTQVSGKTMNIYSFPIRMTDFEFSVFRDPPEVGQHNDEIKASVPN